MNKKIIVILLVFFLVGITGCTEEKKQAEEKYNEGDTKCIDFDLYTFVGNQWTLTERNCPECGYVPEHYEGETKCQGYDKWVYINGAWVLVEEDSEDCGFIRPYDDKEYLTFMSEINDDTLYYAGKVSDYLKSASISLASYYSDKLFETCSGATFEVYTYSVSPKYQEVQDEYYECLSDMSMAAFYTYSGCEAFESKDYELATIYFNSASEYTTKSNVHLDRVTYLLNKIAEDG